MKNRRDGDTEEQGGLDEDEGELKGKETLRSQKRRMAKEFVCAFWQALCSKAMMLISERKIIRGEFMTKRLSGTQGSQTHGGQTHTAQQCEGTTGPLSVICGNRRVRRNIIQMKALRSQKGMIRRKMEGLGKREVRSLGGARTMKSIIYQGRVLAAPPAKWRVHFSSPPRSTLHTALTNVLC